MLSRQPTTSLRSVAVVVVLGCLMLPARLGAQTVPAVELAGGVGIVAGAELFPYTVPVDWLASVAWNATGILSLVGEVAGLAHAQHGISTHDVYTSTLPCADFQPPSGCEANETIQVTRSGSGERQLEVYAFLIGPRFTRRSSRLKPFVHVLVGAARVAWDVTLDALPPGTVRTGRGPGDLDASGPLASQATSMAFQVGAGFDIPVGERLTTRFTADRRQLLGESLFSSQFRLSAQLVVGLGSR